MCPGVFLGIYSGSLDQVPCIRGDPLLSQASLLSQLRTSHPWKWGDQERPLL